MKKIILTTATLALAATFALAQEIPQTGAAAQDQSPSTSAQTSSTRTTSIEGCLSGSTDNYTLTDQSGTQYRVVGDNSALGAAVGHRVRLSGSQNMSNESATSNGESMSHSSNSFQATSVSDLGSHCEIGMSGPAGSNSAQPPSSESPMNEKPPAAQPPHLMAMLVQQQAAPDAGTQASPSGQNSNTPNAQPGMTVPQAGSNPRAGAPTDTAPPPTSSQTPAEQTPPTSPNSQMGSGAANAEGQGSTAGSSAAGRVQEGPQGTNPESTTPPPTSTTTGQGVNPGQNNPAQTNPGATTTGPTTTPQTSNTTTPPQANNDQNKPLYERQATDIPWAQHSGANANSKGTTNNSSTPPQ